MIGGFMKASEALEHMARMSGLSYAAISRAAVGSNKFVSMTISRGSVPRLDTFARLARACGYEVVLRGHGEEIAVTPED
jgi:DNA-binding phage protein